MVRQMIEIDDIILKRKYYFSLDPQQLFYHLINRHVPAICGIGERDYINELYIRFDYLDDSPESIKCKNNLRGRSKKVKQSKFQP